MAAAAISTLLAAAERELAALQAAAEAHPWLLFAAFVLVHAAVFFGSQVSCWQLAKAVQRHPKQHTRIVPSWCRPPSRLAGRVAPRDSAAARAGGPRAGQQHNSGLPWAGGYGRLHLAAAGMGLGVLW